MKAINKEFLLSSFSLFGSLGTLVCCAFPALLVSLGSGATLAALLTNVPQLIWISEHRVLIFGGAAFLLLLAGSLLWKQRKLPCPIDPGQARSCMYFRKMSLWIYCIALLLYGIGFSFVFLASAIF